MRALVWFRSDLRTRDHHALAHACKRADDGVVAVFTICPEQWREHDWADIRVDFVLRNLTALSAALGDLSIPLKIVVRPRFDAVPRALLKLARDLDCGTLFFNEEYEVHERRRDRAVRAAFEKDGRAVESFTDQVVLEPGTVRTGQDTFYTVFTPFRRAWCERYRQGDAPSVLRRPRAQPDTGIAADEVPAAVDGFDPARARPDLWTGGEDHALKRLRRFTSGRIEQYADGRDLPAVNGTSTLSPYLASGVISPRQCLEAAISANGDRLQSGRSKATGADVWIVELIWREFYKHLLIGFPRLSKSRAFRPNTEALRWRDAPEELAAWQEGRTGFPIVDAAMRQLERTGWMHNRLRMISAMFLTKDLLIDWREGERHFMRRLIDGDLAANNGGWQWSASTGTDAAPYFRIFNPTTQGKRYDPEGEFIARFVPELAGLPPRDRHDPSRLGPEGLAELGYPAPICDHREARLRALDAFKTLPG